MFALTTLALAALPVALAQSSNDEQVLGIYMFHRHGDRTAKSTPPANLTNLGYEQVYRSGQYYRNRYIASDADFRINGVNSDIVKQSQIAVSAPADVVLGHSALGFLQGLYPPVGEDEGVSTLRNGTEVPIPLDGYQLITVSEVDQGTNSENNAWLQSAQGCSQATVSSNQYFSSKEYNDLLESTRDFYDSLSPVVNGSFNETEISYKNAYTIYDLINVAQIHNSSYPASDLINDDVFSRLHSLADTHEWGLAYNESESTTHNARAVSAMVLAGEIVEFLNQTITGSGKQKVGIQFGAYATFSSFFGLADLSTANPDLRRVVDYASSMTFELFTNASTTVSSVDYPSADELYVRFLFSNGTASEDAEPTSYALFGSGQDVISWNDFTAGMDKFAISSTERWCDVCSNTDGACAAYATDDSSNGDATTASASKKESGNGLSPVVNGVIGAMVTLAVVLGLEALVLLVGGYKIVSKKTLASSVSHVNAGGEMKSAA